MNMEWLLLKIQHWTADGVTPNVLWWLWTKPSDYTSLLRTGSPITDDQNVLEAAQTRVVPSQIEQLENNGQATGSIRTKWLGATADELRSMEAIGA